jgi:hypothetical protein
VAALPKTDVLTGIADNDIITNESVSQNYPNPFSENSTITVYLKQGAELSLEVTNMAGQQVSYMEKGLVSSGTHYFQLEAGDFVSGIYFYTVQAGENRITKKMIIN